FSFPVIQPFQPKKKRPQWRFLRYTLTIIAHDVKQDAPERF
ncbi:hypothetical protein HMPREF9538_02489, partial [Klebsiella sp. MS 92-3]